MCPPIVREFLVGMRAHTRVRPYKKLEQNNL